MQPKEKAGEKAAPLRISGDVHRFFDLTEVFAHGFGVALIGLTMLVLMKDQWRRVVRVLVCAYGSGLAANVVKLFITRKRPNGYFFDQLPESVWQTFEGWTLLEPLNRAIHSFPSGHAATGVGFAIGLTWLFPRGRWVFALFALLAALQRVVSGAHFVSDTCASAVVACLFAGVCLDSRLLGRWFDRFERKSSS